MESQYMCMPTQLRSTVLLYCSDLLTSRSRYELISRLVNIWVKSLTCLKVSLTKTSVACEVPIIYLICMFYDI